MSRSNTKMIRRKQDSSLSLGKEFRQGQWGKKGRVFLLFLLHVSVWQAFYARTHIMLMMKTEFLDKWDKSPPSTLCFTIPEVLSLPLYVL